VKLSGLHWPLGLRVQSNLARTERDSVTLPIYIPWDEKLLRYNFGPSHPLAPVRVELAMRLAQDLGIISQENLFEPVVLASRDQLLRAHTAEYVDAVTAVSENPELTALEFGLGSSDNPIFAGMHEASARVAGATTMAANAVWNGAAQHAVNLAGGLHHAQRESASGFCIYNDIAVAIYDLLEQGAKRVAYIDIDAHHGDGVANIFYDDPRVLTISIHESPRTLFPGTGLPDETGGPRAPGSCVNIALPAGTGDQGWLRALTSVVPQIIDAFSPEIIFSQNGADSHIHDPLTHLALSVDGQRYAYELIHQLAHRHGGKLVAVGGGGYDIADAVPRSWVNLLAVVMNSNVPKDAVIPSDYLQFVREQLGTESGSSLSDGAQPWAKPIDQGFNDRDPVDSAIMDTRLATFPFFGLDPEVNSWF
jgi:acetoin utilization protein AcuC